MPSLQEQGLTFTPDDLREMALQVAEHYELPRDMFLGLMGHESSWNPNAKNPKSSALGLGQFIDGTARDYFQGLGELNGGPDDPRRHPGYSMDAAARYLKDLYKQHGDWGTAVKRYGENTDAYLGLVQEAARKEADEYQHFQQGQFLKAAAALDVGFGLSPQADFSQGPGALYKQVRNYLGLENEPWKPGPALQAALERYQARIAEEAARNPFPEAARPQDLTPNQLRLAAAQGLSVEDIPSEESLAQQGFQARSELLKVMGRFVDGYTASLSEGAKKAAFGDTLMPTTPGGVFAGQVAYLAGQITGPFKLVKWLTGSYLFPTVEGLRTTTQILSAGMKEGAVNLGILQGLSRVVPALIEHEDFSRWAGSVLNDAKGGALVGLTFPLLSLVPGQGLAGNAARMATGFAALDYLRAAPGHWSTLGQFVQDYQTWDEASKKQFASLSYQYLMDLYFANAVRPIREQLAVHNQNEILQQLSKLRPEEVEQEILAVTGQQRPGDKAPGEEKTKAVPTPETVRELNPETPESIAVPSMAEGKSGQRPDLAEAHGFKPTSEWQLLQDELVYPPGGQFRSDFATGKKYGRWPEGPETGDRGPGPSKEQLAGFQARYPGDKGPSPEERMLEQETAAAGAGAAGAPPSPAVPEAAAAAGVAGERPETGDGGREEEQLKARDPYQEALVRQQGLLQEVEAKLGRVRSDKSKEKLAGQRVDIQQEIKRLQQEKVKHEANQAEIERSMAEKPEQLSAGQAEIQPAPYELWAGLPVDMEQVLQGLREGSEPFKNWWQRFKAEVTGHFSSPLLSKDAGKKAVAQALVQSMGRSSLEVEDLKNRLWDFRRLFQNMKQKEWVATATIWQGGGRTGSDLDRAYELYHESNEAMFKQIKLIDPEGSKLRYQENYIRQAYSNSNDPAVNANYDNLAKGRAFRNYSDLDAKGQPRLWRKVGEDAQGNGIFAPVPQEQVEGGAGVADNRIPEAPESGGFGRTLTGGREYFQKKTIPNWAEAVMAGFKPRFPNLWDLLMYDASQKSRFIHFNHLMKWCWGQGYVQEMLRGKQPLGWQEIKDDSQQISYAYLREVMEGEPFQEKAGDYQMSGPPKYQLGVASYRLYAPRDIAKLFNDFLEPGISHKAVYQLYRWPADKVRALGVIGPFHLRFIANGSLAMGQGQAVSRAMGQLLTGDLEGLGRGIKEAGLNQAGIRFIQQLWKGRQGVQAILNDPQNAHLAPILEGMRDYLDTGGKVSAQAAHSVARNLGQGLWQGLVNLDPHNFHPFRSLDEVMGGLMTPIATTVEWAKVGGFLSMRQGLEAKLKNKYEELAKAPEADAGELLNRQEQEFRDGLFQINRHLDNIYGQMNYDALLMKRWQKDMLFFLIKYPGWNIGSGRWMMAMGAGIKHSLTPGQETSEYEKLSLQMGLGLLLATGINSGLMYWFINGRLPDWSEIPTLYLKGVWSGGYAKDGRPEYLSEASYWKDLRGMVPFDQNMGFTLKKPWETITSKAADIWRVPMELANNRENYNRYEIFSREAKNWPGELLWYAGKQVSPYLMRNIAGGDTWWGKYGALIGQTRTAARLTDTPLRQELRESREARAPQLVTTVQQGGRQVKRDVMDLAYQGDGPGFLAALAGARSRGEVNAREFKELLRNGEEVIRDPHFGPLRLGFWRLPLGEAIRVYGLATPEEREALHREMLGKWGRAQPEQRRKYRQEFMELEAKIAAGG